MNCRPHPYQGCALPTELPGQNSRLTHCGCSFCMHPPSLERVMGIEPTQSAWKAEVLPLNYTRITIDAPAQRATGSLRPAQRSPALRAFVEPLFRFSSSPTWPRRDTKLWWRGRITPRLRRSALRVAAPCAALSGASRLRRTSFRFSSSPTWPRRDTKLWWRGEDYSTPPAFRPPGRCALRSALRRFAPTSNLFRSTPPPAKPRRDTNLMVEGGGFEPPKAEPSDLQSDPFDRSGTPPKKRRYSLARQRRCQLGISTKASSGGINLRHAPW